jgi:hypothetical protein
MRKALNRKNIGDLWKSCLLDRLPRPETAVTDFSSPGAETKVAGGNPLPVAKEGDMFPRFAAASAIASIAIAIAALILRLLPGMNLARIYPVTILWCVVPVAWGLWALLTPTSWLPQRLPAWGAILGLVASSLAGLALNLPSRLLGVDVPLSARAVGVVVMAAFYYLLWMLVRAAYRSLEGARKA